MRDLLSFITAARDDFHAHHEPDGREFGNPALRIKTVSAFKRIAAGYLFPYGVGEPYQGPHAFAGQWARDRFEEELAKAIEARSGETERLDPKGESAARQGLPNSPIHPTTKDKDQ